MPRLRRPEGASDSRLQLLDEIEVAITPFLDSIETPKLSLEQILVIAVLFERKATFKRIVRWIVGNFPYYRNIALDVFCRQIERNCDSDDWRNQPRELPFLLELRRIPWEMDVPIYISALKSVEPDDRLEEFEKCLLTAVDDEARYFFRSLLLPPLALKQHRRPFTFLRLPSDIRLYIYELLLVFPQSGIAVLHPSQPRIQVATKDFRDYDSSLWEPMRRLEECEADYSLDSEETYPVMYEGPWLRQHLAILQTNRQIYTEAMPVFYSINHFVCLGMEHLRDFLKQAPTRRMHHIREFTMDLPPPDFGPPPKYQDGFAIRELLPLLATFTGLRRLRIVVRGYWRTHEASILTVARKEVLRDLKKLRGLEKFEVEGGSEELCRELREFLEVEKMMQPRAEVVGEEESGRIAQKVVNERRL